MLINYDSVEENMNDYLFQKFFTDSFRSNPFKVLPIGISQECSNDQQRLHEAFCAAFHDPSAKESKNVVFMWVLDKPFPVRSGNSKSTPISYIEISKRTIAERWPDRFFINITKDYTHRGEVGLDADLQELADRDKNFLYYSTLIRDYGPMRIWVATLEELNEVAQPNLSWTSVREWERHLIKSHRTIYGFRPPKNRRD